MIWLILAACGPLELDPPEPYAWVVYDPASSALPLPNDLARDAESGRLALPIDEAMSAAEQAVRARRSQQDAWPSTSPLSFTVSEPLAPASVSAGSVQVWEWGLQPGLVEGLTVTEDALSVEVSPPEGGWSRGGRYAVFLHGLQTSRGVPVGPDAAFH